MSSDTRHGSRVLARLFVVLTFLLVGAFSIATPSNASSLEEESEMPITRINRFSAKPGLGDELYALVESFLSYIRESDGCVDVKILRDVDDSDQILVIEVWRDREAHQASAANVPEGTFPKAMALMSEPPGGGYYQ